MKNFHGYNKKSSYFEGWYFKNQSDDCTFSVIPSMSINKDGKKSAFIQIITASNSYNIEYDFSDFKASKNNFMIKIKDNIFCKQYIKLNIKTEEVTCCGKIVFDSFTPIKYNIMGIFGLIPFMECNHGIISLYHKLKGKININGKIFNFNNGTGYIEKDWGTSFPKKYIWVQSNDFNKQKSCIIASIADIPFMKLKFKGCICCIYYEGKEYRLATYKGVRIVKYDDKSLILEQKKYKLEIFLKPNSPQQLNAPSKGDMSTIIYENLCCKSRFIFSKNNNIIFDYISPNTSFEMVI